MSPIKIRPDELLTQPNLYVSQAVIELDGRLTGNALQRAL